MPKSAFDCYLNKGARKKKYVIVRRYVLDPPPHSPTIYYSLFKNTYAYACF